jgi:hypothetical protein
MKKITMMMVQAFNNELAFKVSNTVVRVCNDEVAILLYGHKIAFKNDTGFYIDTCGYPTATTKERLNGLHGVQVNTKKGALFLNGSEWDGSLTLIQLWIR